MPGVIHRGVDDHHGEAEINHGRVGRGSRQMSRPRRCKPARTGELITGAVSRATGRVDRVMLM